MASHPPLSHSLSAPRVSPLPSPSILRAPSAPLPLASPPSRWNRFTRRVATLIRPSKAKKAAEEKSKEVSRFVKTVSFGDIYYHEPAPPPSELRVEFPTRLDSGFSSLPTSILFRVAQPPSA